MSHLTYRDGEGREWQVWNVVPQELGEPVERRVAVRRRREEPPPADRRKLLDRRTGTDRRARLRHHLRERPAAGWLVFASGSERYRVLPVPDGWEELSPEELEGLRRSVPPGPPVGGASLT